MLNPPSPLQQTHGAQSLPADGQVPGSSTGALQSDFAEDVQGARFFNNFRGSVLHLILWGLR